jgi:DNA polymerase III alpha subunit (gram-positive type)
MNFLVIDTETGGLDPKINPVLQIAMRLYHEDGTVDLTFNKIIEWAGADQPISVGAIGVNSYKFTDGYNPRCVAIELVQFLAAVSARGNVCLLGQNLQFDIEFIESFLSRQGFTDWKEPFRYRRLDTSALALFLVEARLLPYDLRFSLKALYGYFFKADIPEAHNALGDVDATWKVYKALLDLTRTRTKWDGTSGL